jgi:hypothetical protein
MPAYTGMLDKLRGSATPMQMALAGVRGNVGNRPLTAPSLNVPAPAPTAPAPSTSPQVSTAVEPYKTSITQPQVGDTTAPQGADIPSDNLGMWGYTGPVGINDYEQQALDFINEIYGTQGPLATMMPGQDYYNKVLNGDFGAEGNTYLQNVLDPMRASAMRDYEEMSKGLANRFSQFGGYYGGKSGIAQGRLASDTANNMAQQEANLRYQAYVDDLTRRGGAAEGLRGLGTTQSAISGDILNQLMTGGNMLTQREFTNRAEYQNALQRSYQDWLRARQEQLMPFSMAGSLLGTQATMPVVTQTQSPWGALLGAGGAFLGSKI